jgi:hypothetical protein
VHRDAISFELYPATIQVVFRDKLILYKNAFP